MDPQHPQYRPQPHQAPPPTPSNTGPAQSYSTPTPQHDYSFIMEPANPFPKRSALSLGGGSSSIAKIAMGAGILFVLLIFFVLLKGISGSGGPKLDMPSLLGVLQDQTELIHLTSLNSSLQRPPAGINAVTTSSRATVSLTVGDAQSKILSYLKTNHKKVDSKQIALKISRTTDAQLVAAGTNGDYDQTYQTIMSSKLTLYEQDLKTAYAKNTGTKARTLLNSEYKQAQLLQQQLSEPTS